MPKSYAELHDRLLKLEERVQRGNCTAIDKQHREGKCNARERLAKLRDRGSFCQGYVRAESPWVDVGVKSPGVTRFTKKESVRWLSGEA